MEHESDSDTNCYQCTQYSHQRFGKGTERIGNKKMGGDHLNYCFIKIRQNTEKRSGDLRSLAVI